MPPKHTTWSTIIARNHSVNKRKCSMFFFSVKTNVWWILRHSQWRSSCICRPGNIPNKSNLHTKCACNRACTFDGLLNTISSLNTFSIRSTASGRLVRNTVDYPIEFPLNKHPRLVRMFWLYSDTFQYFPFDLNTRNIQAQYLLIFDESN